MDVKMDVKKAMSKFDGSKRAVTAAAASALNKSMREIKTYAVNELKAEIGAATGLSVSGLRAALQERRATRQRLESSIHARGRPIPLIRFGARQTAKGVTANAWGRRKLYKGSFIATMPSVHKGVFSRTSDKRLPIKEKWGPSVSKEFLNLKLNDLLSRRAAVAWPKHWQRELKYYLARYAK